MRQYWTAKNQNKAGVTSTSPEFWLVNAPHFVPLVRRYSVKWLEMSVSSEVSLLCQRFWTTRSLYRLPEAKSKFTSLQQQSNNLRFCVYFPYSATELRYPLSCLTRDRCYRQLACNMKRTLQKSSSTQSHQLLTLHPIEILAICTSIVLVLGTIIL